MKRTLITGLALSTLALATSAQSFPWTTLSPPTSPSARERVGGATDGTVLYLYGGQVNTTTNGYDNLLSFDGTTWTELTASGASCGPRTNPSMAWDDARGKLVVFGGKGAGGIWANFAQDTWEWDPVGGWVQMSPALVPDGRWFASAVYAPGVGVVFHGGSAVDALGTGYIDNQTYAWDGTNWSVIATGPSKNNHTLVYRPATHDLVLFGGTDVAGGTKSAETWKLDLTTMTWSQVVTATLPTSSAATGGPGLVGAPGYVNPYTGRVVLHGGQGNGGAPSSWTWEFDGVDWTDISWPGTPGLRNAPGLWLNATQKGYALCGNDGPGAKNWTQQHEFVFAGSFTVQGAACPGSTGLFASVSALGPQIGLNWTLNLNNTTPGAIPFALIGWSDTAWVGGSLPSPVSGLFPGTPPGCDLQVSPNLIFAMTSAAGSASYVIPIPNDPTIIGLTFFAQGAQAELAPTGLWVSTSDYGVGVIG